MGHWRPQGAQTGATLMHQALPAEQSVHRAVTEGTGGILRRCRGRSPFLPESCLHPPQPQGSPLPASWGSVGPQTSAPLVSLVYLLRQIQGLIV